MKETYLSILTILIWGTHLFSQQVPAVDENIPYLVVFGSESKTSWGDDDFSQVFFFVVPASHTTPVYIRVFDPDCGGQIDEAKGAYNTVVNYSVYGGHGCWSDEDARNLDPEGNYRSGMELASKSFGNESNYDRSYYTFGPFNPFEGEYVEKFDGRVFKIIAQGTSGDDGNLYRYFLSSRSDANVAIEGGNAFTYEYTFRLHDSQDQVSQIYPFVDDKTISIEISNFDWDNDGEIRIISVAKNNILNPVSGENQWIVRKHPITEEEKNSTFEIRFVKDQSRKILNNNVVLVVRNQYGETLPFFVIPIGGRPVYTPKIKMKGF